MRQAGILAAAGIVALEKMTSRLAEDHRRALRLAKGLASTPGVRLDPERPDTNMVFFELESEVGATEKELEDRVREHGILIHSTGPRRFRLVTHYWIDDGAIDATIEAIGAALA
jgi:threonine aldolase